MATWGQFAEREPEIAAFGAARVDEQVCYLATVRADGSPRVHPVTPMIRDGRVFVRMYPTSPKAHDLRRNGRYVMHSAVANSEGEGGEFAFRGRAAIVEDDSALNAVHAGRSGEPSDYVVFEFTIEEAMATEYDAEGPPTRRLWKSPR